MTAPKGNETSSKLSTMSARTSSGRIANAGSSATSSLVSTVSGTLMPHHPVAQLALDGACREDCRRASQELGVGGARRRLGAELQQQLTAGTSDRADQLARARTHERGSQLRLRILQIERQLARGCAGVAGDLAEWAAVDPNAQRCLPRRVGVGELERHCVDA